MPSEESQGADCVRYQWLLEGTDTVIPQCDEQKPGCARCAHSKRECEWPTVSSSSSRRRRTSLPTPSLSSSSTPSEIREESPRSAHGTEVGGSPQLPTPLSIPSCVRSDHSRIHLIYLPLNAGLATPCTTRPGRSTTRALSYPPHRYTSRLAHHLQHHRQHTLMSPIRLQPTLRFPLQRPHFLRLPRSSTCQHRPPVRLSRFSTQQHTTHISCSNRCHRHSLLRVLP